MVWIILVCAWIGGGLLGHGYAHGNRKDMRGSWIFLLGALALAAYSTWG